MNYFSGEGEWLRRTGAANVRAILSNSKIETIFIERAAFLSGFDLYEARPDKGHSLTDCISMNVMRDHGIADVLTHDAHFTQEGFHILLKDGSSS